MDHPFTLLVFKSDGLVVMEEICVTQVCAVSKASAYACARTSTVIKLFQTIVSLVSRLTTRACVCSGEYDVLDAMLGYSIGVGGVDKLLLWVFRRVECKRAKYLLKGPPVSEFHRMYNACR